MKNAQISLRGFTTAQKKREFLEKQLNIKLDNISNFTFEEEQVAGRNIENLIGATQMPLGVAGPLSIKKIATGPSNPHNDKGSKDYFIPLLIFVFYIFLK